MKRPVNTELLRQAVRNVAEHESYDLAYSAVVRQFAKDVSAEYARLTPSGPLEPKWNVVLRGGPRDGTRMQLRAEIARIVEYVEDGDYVRTEDVEDGRTVFLWAPTTREFDKAELRRITNVPDHMKAAAAHSKKVAP